MKVILEIRGGNLAECYSDEENLEVILVDWDNLDEGGEAGPVRLKATSSLPLETQMVLEDMHRSNREVFLHK